MSAVLDQLPVHLRPLAVEAAEAIRSVVRGDKAGLDALGVWLDTDERTTDLLVAVSAAVIVLDPDVRANVMTVTDHAGREVPVEVLERSPGVWAARLFLAAIGRDWDRVRDLATAVVAKGDSFCLDVLMVLAHRGGQPLVAELCQCPRHQAMRAARTAVRPALGQRRFRLGRRVRAWFRLRSYREHRDAVWADDFSKQLRGEI